MGRNSHRCMVASKDRVVGRLEVNHRRRIVESEVAVVVVQVEYQSNRRYKGVNQSWSQVQFESRMVPMRMVPTRMFRCEMVDREVVVMGIVEGR